MAVSVWPGRISSGQAGGIAAAGDGGRHSDGRCPCRVACSSMASSRNLVGVNFLGGLDFVKAHYVGGFTPCILDRASVIAGLGLRFRKCGSEFRRTRYLRKVSAKSETSSRRDVLPQTSTSRPQHSAPPHFQTPRNDAVQEEQTADEIEALTEKTASLDNGSTRVDVDSSLKPSSSTKIASETEDAEGSSSEEEGGLPGAAALGTIAVGVGLIAVLGGFGAIGVLYKDQINALLIQFSDFIEGYGPAGYGLFVLVYAGLEVLAIPAIPLTMSAGLLFGPTIGTVIVSIAGTIAATAAFLIARYLARDRILELAKNNKKFLAIDKAIGEDGFRVVTLLRLSPLLPFSLGNYLYGLTSVKLFPYVLGSWLGMLPGTWAYVSAGAIGRAFIQQQESEPFWTGGSEQLWTLGLGLAATVFAATYVTRLAKSALKDLE